MKDRREFGIEVVYPKKEKQATQEFCGYKKLDDKEDGIGVALNVSRTLLAMIAGGVVFTLGCHPRDFKELVICTAVLVTSVPSLTSIIAKLEEEKKEELKGKVLTLTRSEIRKE